jgi:ATP-binding cassette subfamily F protein uup
MSALLSCRNLSKSYAGRRLFHDLTLTLHEGERVGLIGPNGAGKSTLLKLLADLEPADAGERALRQGVTLGYLPQEERFPADRTVEDVVRQSLEAEGLDEVAARTRTRIVLGKVGFDDPGATAGTLSGGWRKRLSLARVLAREPDLVLFDEPTNHLDLLGIAWLEKLLAGSGFASLVVTHDRYFLERVANRIIEIGAHYPGGFLSVPGNYSSFLLKREEFLEAQQKRERSLANTVRREVEWLRRGPQGRGTKAKARIQRAHETMGELDAVRARNQSGGTAAIDFTASGRKTRDLLVAEGVSASHGGPPVFEDVTLRLGPGERIGLIGDNGSGKSTLLKVLAGELEPTAGILRRAHQLRVVVFHQERSYLDPEATVRDTLCPEGDTVTFQGRGMHVTAWGKRFRFDEEQLQQRVGALSGGEQARLLIADLVRRPADLLLLDEPTNDLDLPTREVLEESLLEFGGALVLVTHDRYMLERVCTGLVGLRGGRAHPLADLDQWGRLVEREEQALRAAKQAEKAEKAKPPPEARRVRKGLSNRERQELDGMEDTITELEAQIESLEAQTQDPDVLADHLRLQAACAALAEAQKRQETLYARWEELEAKKG